MHNHNAMEAGDVLGRGLDGAGLRRLDHRRPRDHAALVRVVLSDREGPLRTLAGTGHRHLIGLGRDPRSGVMNPVEGVTEPALNRLLVADPDAIDHQTQPGRIELVVEGTWRVYLPDYWVLWANGILEFGEVKIHPGQIRDPGYVAKLEAVKSALALLNCDFRVRYAREILGTPEKQINVGMIHYDRAANLDLLDPAALDSLVGSGPLPFAELASAIWRGDDGRAAVRRLVTQGRVWFDIDTLLTDDTPMTVRPAARLLSPARLQ